MFLPFSQRHNKNLKNEVKINLTNILIPKIFSRNIDFINKRKQYEFLIEYLYNKLCIKEILSRINDIDKLKYHVLTKEELILFESRLNPLPNTNCVKNVWAHEFLMSLNEGSYKFNK